jgi:type IV pilus assembly protein PilE
MKKRAQGFTLMELMVVIVIVAILAAVAVPLYVNYVKDAQRTEAKGAIGAVITAEQTYFQVNGTYIGDTFIPNPADHPGTQQLNCDLTDALNNWDITATSTTGGFTVTAIGKAQAAGRKVVMTYTRTGGASWNDTDPQ